MRAGLYPVWKNEQRLIELTHELFLKLFFVSFIVKENP
jgi:hypothetical protein